LKGKNNGRNDRLTEKASKMLTSSEMLICNANDLHLYFH